MKVETSAHGEAAAYEALMDKFEGMELKIAKERANEESISVSIVDL